MEPDEQHQANVTVSRERLWLLVGMIALLGMLGVILVELLHFENVSKTQIASHLIIALSIAASVAMRVRGGSSEDL